MSKIDTFQLKVTADREWDEVVHSFKCTRERFERLEKKVDLLMDHLGLWVNYSPRPESTEED